MKEIVFYTRDGREVTFERPYDLLGMTQGEYIDELRRRNRLQAYMVKVLPHPTRQ